MHTWSSDWKRVDIFTTVASQQVRVMIQMSMTKVLSKDPLVYLDDLCNSRMFALSNWILISLLPVVY
jgi:hypothetical protein